MLLTVFFSRDTGDSSKSGIFIVLVEFYRTNSFGDKFTIVRGIVRGKGCQGNDTWCNCMDFLLEIV